MPSGDYTRAPTEEDLGTVTLIVNNGNGHSTVTTDWSDNPEDGHFLKNEKRKSWLDDDSIQNDELRGVLMPVLCVLRWLGFYRRITIPFSKNTRGGQIKHIIVTIIMLTAIGINVYFAYFIGNIYLQFYVNSGILNVSTMSALLLGLRPCVNAVILLVMYTMETRHTRLLLHLHHADRVLMEGLQFRPPWRRVSIKFWITVVTLCATLFVLQGIQMLAIINDDGYSDWLILSSPFFAPLLGMWQTFPLLYFLLLTTSVRHYFTHLSARLKNDLQYSRNTSTFYYESFETATSLVASLNDFFGAFVFISISFGIFIMCVLIYFMTNATDMLGGMETQHGPWGTIHRLTPTVWCTVIIAIYMLHVVCIAVAGSRLNEEARAFTELVFKADSSTTQNRFNFSRFMARVQLQPHSWGLSVWRAVPIERRLLFTVFGVVSTYAVLLLRLQTEHQKRVFMTNVTSTTNDYM